MLGTIVLIAIMFVIVLIHEAGHLIVAKMNDIAVKTYSIGFGPRVFGIKFYKGKISYRFFNFQPSSYSIWNLGETEYRIAPIPFGGFCAMEDELVNKGNNPRALVNKGYLQKVSVALAGAFFNIVTGLGVLWYVLFPIYGNRTFSTLMKMFYEMAITLYTQLWLLVTGVETVAKWSEVSSATASMLSFEGILMQFGAFSIVLAIFNLIPFPALDGALPILWGLESVFGKKEGQKIANTLSLIGFIILSGLQLFLVGYWIFVK